MSVCSALAAGRVRAALLGLGYRTAGLEDRPLKSGLGIAMFAEWSREWGFRTAGRLPLFFVLPHHIHPIPGMSDVRRFIIMKLHTSWSGLEAVVTVKWFFAAQFYEF